MRFLLIVASIAGLCFYAFRGCSELKDRMVPKLSGAFEETDGKAHRVAAAVAGNPVSVPMPMGAKPNGNSQAQGGERIPEHCEVVTFQHRAFPSQEFWNQFSSIGVRIVADEPGRIAYVFGEPEATIRAASALRASDVLPQSCSLKAWAVYVDRRVGKGWDLVAALGSILQVPDSIKLGGGHLTFDFSAGDLQAALDVVADGAAVEVLQAPYCLLLNREAATVEAIQEVPLPSTVVSQGVSQSSVQYRKVGLQLEVMPEFYGEDRVRLKVSQSNGLIGANVEVSGSQVPVIETQRVASTVELTIGQAVVLGGVRTTRQRTLKGILRDKSEVVEGSLYIVLATGRDAPRAVTVDPGDIELPASILEREPMPFAVPAVEAEEWIDGQLLPPRDWQREERAFLKGRGGRK